eukprot:CAMPEP_0119125726 /NCGR_PEP_ID=MMETSP1310-20130426/4902_1 /TAXON_ID=464262 /ORGANISM="Genus nov. species nov., Strain RCC2339" /LENGTH=780 /DNA_ID=CAMNT_0007115825 /DNA_START=50 /DNA_END=2389 /DNA_ORIENTATION=+
MQRKVSGGKGAKSVGSPQNVLHCTSFEMEESDRRLWYKKYKREKPSDAAPRPSVNLSEKGSLDPVRLAKITSQVEMAVTCLGHSDKGAQEHGLKVLVKMGQSESNLHFMRNAVEHCVLLMDSDSSVVQMFATYVLAHLALLPSNQEVLLGAGTIPRSLSILQTGNSEVLEKDLLLLRNLSRHRHNREAIVEQGGIAILASLLAHPSLSVVQHVCVVLRNMFFEVVSQEAFMSLGGLETLMQLQNRKMFGPLSEEIRYEWTSILCILSYLSGNIRRRLVKGGLIETLSLLLSSKDLRVKDNATQSLTNLSVDEANVEPILTAASATSLVQQLVTSRGALKEHTASLLMNLALRSDQMLECFTQYGGTEAIMRILVKEKDHVESVLLQHIILVFATVARNELCRQDLLRLGAMPELEGLSKEASGELLDAVEMALHNLRLPFEQLKDHKEVGAGKTQEPGAMVLDEGGGSSKQAAHRFRVVNEIISTEKKYVENLLVIVKVYMEPLEKKGKLATLDERVKIFSIVDSLVKLHSSFLQKLEKCVREQRNRQQLQVGQLFLELAEQLKEYRVYINNYDESCDVLMECMARPAFAKWLEETSQMFQTKSLSSLLITPIQRIPRYCLLLTDLVRHMEEDHPDYAHVSQALQTISNIADYLEEEKQKAYSISEIGLMQKSLIGNDYDFLEDSRRRFIRQGAFILDPAATHATYFSNLSALSKKSQYLHFWLLSDKLVMGIPEKKDSQFRLSRIFELKSLSVSKKEDTSEDLKKFVLCISSEGCILSV